MELRRRHQRLPRGEADPTETVRPQLRRRVRGLVGAAGLTALLSILVAAFVAAVVLIAAVVAITALG
jgi:hypothetical protein